MLKTVREREVRQYFIKRVKDYGGEVRKVRWISRRSAPDELATFSKWCCFFLAELKRPGNKATAQQAREHEKLKAAGMPVVTLDSKEAIDRHLNQLEKKYEIQTKALPTTNY